MNEFLDVKTGFAFKKIFSSEESTDILINFLNSVIPFENHRQACSFGRTEIGYK